MDDSNIIIQSILNGTYQSNQTLQAMMLNLQSYYESVIENIKTDIAKYEADCKLSNDSKECKKCDEIVFSTIYSIIDRHTSGKEQE